MTLFHIEQTIHCIDPLLTYTVQKLEKGKWVNIGRSLHDSALAHKRMGNKSFKGNGAFRLLVTGVIATVQSHRSEKS